MTRKHDTTFERADETEVTVEYTISAFDPGCTYGPAENCYPPEGGEVEIISVKDLDGKPVQWTDDEAEAWADWIAQNHDFSVEQEYYEDER